MNNPIMLGNGWLNNASERFRAPLVEIATV